jgi:hypothetical protein
MKCQVGMRKERTKKHKLVIRAGTRHKPPQFANLSHLSTHIAQIVDRERL